MRVLFLPAWYPSDEEPLSGVFVRDHAKAAALHHEIAVLFVQSVRREKAGPRWEMVAGFEDGIRTVRTRVRTGIQQRQVERAVRLAAYFWSFKRFVRTQWRPDVLHAHVYAAGLPAVFMGKRHGIPVVVSEHWTWFIQQRLTLGRRLVARWVFNRADAVLVVSEHLREALRQYGVRNAIRVVPNAVDTEAFFPADNADGHTRGETKRIVFVGRLSPEKGVPFLLEAIALLRRRRDDFTLDIVGDGEQREQLMRLAVALGVAPVVRFCGLQPKIEVARAMRACDFFVQPSLYETFGIAPIEAIACGKPVIVSDIPGPRELIGPEMGLRVPPGDANSLAGAIDTMLDSHGRYSPDTLAEYVRSRFSHAAVGQALDETYHQVLARART